MEVDGHFNSYTKAYSPPLVVTTILGLKKTDVSDTQIEMKV